MPNAFLTLTIILVAALVTVSAAAPAATQHWDPRDAFIADLTNAIDGILKSQDPASGRFGTKPWICSDQNVLLPLAAAWTIKHDKNPWYHNARLLDAIMAGGDALTDDQDPKGMWTFRKKDSSTWGQIYMPWTYSRCVRAYLLIKDAMPADRRAKWEKGLLKGYSGISKTCLGHVHNIPSHHAMGLYAAGVAFNRDDWKKQAAAFMHKVVAAQSPDGWWSEHVGPVVAYNFVYSDALGVYYAMSGDLAVLDALRKAAVFHANVTYPDGSGVETVDERNPYHDTIRLGNVGFSMTPEGRGFLLRQHALYKGAPANASGDSDRLPLLHGPSVSADHAASMLLYGHTGDAIPTAAGRAHHTWTSKDGKIVVLRSKPWFIVASGYTAKVPQNRWIQDRQNFISVFHDKLGLIVGGGNTKLQPYWSSFTVGDPALLAHKPGDTNPKFIPPPGLKHVPDAATVALDDRAVRVTLTYGKLQARIEAATVDDKTVRITTAASDDWTAPVEAHITLLPHLKSPVTPAAGAPIKLGSASIDIPAAKLGDSIRHAGWQLTVPPAARLLWPKHPHNPYKKDGSSTPAESRIVLAIPLTPRSPSTQLTLATK